MTISEGQCEKRASKRNKGIRRRERAVQPEPAEIHEDTV